MPDRTIAARLLNVMEHDILPMTERGVAAGNKVFGAAILRKSDLSLVVAETNNELENPLWHGEVHTLKRFYELGREACHEGPDLSLDARTLHHVHVGDHLGRVRQFLLFLQPRGFARRLRHSRTT